jgi:hypothetical protein
MKRLLRSLAVLTFLLPPGAAVAAGSGAEKSLEIDKLRQELLIDLRVPLTSPLFATTPVAVVDDEPITLRDLTKRIASIHEDKVEEPTQARKNYAKLLDRVITTKLIVHEARNIGLDELPAIASQIEEVSVKLLFGSLMSSQLETVEADPVEVDALYRRLSREFLLTALTFKREEDALAFEQEYKADGDFNPIARRFIEKGRADGEIDGEQYVKLKDLRPQLAQAAFDMEAGSVSPIFSVSGESLLFYLHDMRFYEDAGVEEEARQKILEPLQKEKANEYVDFLIAKYATIDRQLLDEIDLERETTGFLWSREERPVDFAKLLADQRVLATVNGDEPFTVTVADVAAAVEERHFHGIEKAAEKRKLNREKWPVLRDMLLKRAAVLEAARQGRDQTDDYLESIGEYTTSLLFDTFINKVVAPDVAISEDEVREYHREHIEDFSSPVMYRMNGLAFYAERDAQTALDKLRRGADARWVSANSPGQVDKESEAASVFDDAVLSLTAMPEELREAAGRTRQGGALLYSSPEGYHHVISIDKVFPAEPQPYEAVRGDIAKILFQAKLEALIDEWSGKLKEGYETRIFVTGLAH